MTTIDECLIFCGAFALCLIMSHLSEITDLLHKFIEYFIEYNNKSLDKRR